MCCAFCSETCGKTEVGRTCSSPGRRRGFDDGGSEPYLIVLCTVAVKDSDNYHFSSARRCPAFNIQYAASRLFQVQGYSVSVFVHSVVIYATAFVVFQFFFSK